MAHIIDYYDNIAPFGIDDDEIEQESKTDETMSLPNDPDTEWYK